MLYHVCRGRAGTFLAGNNQCGVLSYVPCPHATVSLPTCSDGVVILTFFHIFPHSTSRAVRTRGPVSTAQHISLFIIVVGRSCFRRRSSSRRRCVVIVVIVT